LRVPDSSAARIYGGQLLAQMISAAQRGHAPKTVSALHVSFPREGKPSDPVYLDLVTEHAGRSLGFVRATLWQPAADLPRKIALATLLLDAGDEGPASQMLPPPPTPPGEGREVTFALVPGQCRLVSETALDDPRVGEAALQFWLRAEHFDDDTLSRALIGYVSDWPLIGTLMKPLPDVNERDAHVLLQTGVIAHSLWFHAPFDASRWLYVDIRGHRLGGGRGFGLGSVFDEQGTLVASFAQHSVIRPIRDNTNR
jgi:acyl-CoA thioesterase-2